MTGKPKSLSLGRACYGLKARGKGAAAKKLARRGERIRGFLAADKKGGSFARECTQTCMTEQKIRLTPSSGQKDLSA